MYPYPPEPIRRTVFVTFSLGFLAIGCNSRSDMPTSASAAALVQGVADTSSEWSNNDRYIVVLRDSTTDLEQILSKYGLRRTSESGRNAFLSRPGRVLDDSSARVFDVYRRDVLNGFGAKLTRAQVIRLRADQSVLRVDVDAILHPHGTGSQVSAPWHLDRIDQRDGSDNTYTWDSDGFGVKIYIVDTGIDFADADFGGRAVPGFDAFGTGGAPSTSQGAIAYHGTGSASQAIGSQYGVAKSATAISVKIGLGYNLNTTDIVNGLNWIKNNFNRPGVVNMSLGGPANTNLDNAVKSLLNANIPVVVSAGNGNVDACTQSPSRVDGATTVGASDQADQRAFFGGGQASNFGACVDLFAPGLNNPSAYWTAMGYNGFSGTSAAAPIVAGIAARYLSTNFGASAREVENQVRSNASPNRIGNSTGSAPNLAFTEPFAPTKSVLYDAFVQTYAWLPKVYDSMMAGTTARNLSLRAFRANLAGPFTGSGASLRYQAQLNGAWQPEYGEGSIAGTIGNSGAVTALRMRLASNPFGNSFCYQVHQAIIGWQGLACDGATAGDGVHEVQAIRIYVYGMSTYGLRSIRPQVRDGM